VHAPDAHATPHAPQLFGSAAGFEQTPSQQTPSMTSAKSYGRATFPNRHATPETPAAHVATTHAPFASPTVPEGQAPTPPSGPWHVLLMHAAPAGQAVPQAPQLVVVANPLTHTLEQHAPAPPSGSAHATPEFASVQTVGAEHSALLQTLVATHAFPQLPQLALSMASTVQLDPQQEPHAAVTMSPTNDS